MAKCNHCGAEMASGAYVCDACGERQTFSQSTDPAKPPAPKQTEPNAAAKMLLSSIDFMSVEELLNAGKMYYSGAGGQQQNFEVSFKLFHAAAIKGSALAMYYVAEHMAKGYVKADTRDAIWWYVQSSKAGCTEARMVLSEALRTELPIVEEKKVLEQSGGLSDAVKKVRRFCVEIFASSGERSGSSGSGCIISPEYIITNHHVVFNENQNRLHRDLTMNFHPAVGDKYSYRLKVVASDEREDIAVCTFMDKITLEEDDFPELRDAHSLDVGEKVFTIGNALGRGLALSAGVVAKEVEYNKYGKSEVIRTDMSINGGNSGGPLFDRRGNMVGLMTFVLNDMSSKNKTTAYGLSYAITSNTIAKLFENQ